MRAVEAHYCRQSKRSGLQVPKTGAISVVQRWNSAIQLDVHFHVLFADGTWHQGNKGVLFTPAPALHTEQVQAVLADAHKRIARQLKKFGWHDEEGWRESKVDTLRATDPALAELLSSAVRGQQLTGEQAGQLPSKEGKLRTVEPKAHGRNCAEWDGYSLHANTRVGELARAELEKLCRPHSRRDIESRLARYAQRGGPCLPPGDLGEPDQPVTRRHGAHRADTGMAQRRDRGTDPARRLDPEDGGTSAPATAAEHSISRVFCTQCGLALAGRASRRQAEMQAAQDALRHSN